MDVDTLDLILGLLIEIIYIFILLIHRYKDRIQKFVDDLVGSPPT